MSDYSDLLRTALEAARAELLDNGDWLPGTSRAHKIIDKALATQNPNAIEVEIRKTEYGHDVRCHGANGIATIGAGSSLDDALYALAGWARREAESRNTEGIPSV